MSDTAFMQPVISHIVSSLVGKSQPNSEQATFWQKARRYAD